MRKLSGPNRLEKRLRSRLLDTFAAHVDIGGDVSNPMQGIYVYGYDCNSRDISCLVRVRGRHVKSNARAASDVVDRL